MKITRLKLKTIDNKKSEIFHEINGINEYPTALIGEIAEKFMSLPKEILILTLKSNQKFHLPSLIDYFQKIHHL